MIRVYDGDTVWVKVNMGNPWGVVRFSCRLYGYDTSEIRGGSAEEKKLGHAARNFLRQIVLNKPVLVHFGEYDKYGRPLVDLNLLIKGGTRNSYVENKQSVNDMVVKGGHGVVYMGTNHKKDVQDEKFIGDGLTTTEIVQRYTEINRYQDVPSCVEDRDNHYLDQ